MHNFPVILNQDNIRVEFGNAGGFPRVARYLFERSSDKDFKRPIIITSQVINTMLCTLN